MSAVADAVLRVLCPVTTREDEVALVAFTFVKVALVTVAFVVVELPTIKSVMLAKVARSEEKKPVVEVLLVVVRLVIVPLVLKRVSAVRAVADAVVRVVCPFTVRADDDALPRVV